MWHFAGTYGISALIYAIDRCLNGKKARSEYIKKPVSILLEEESKPKSKESNEDTGKRGRHIKSVIGGSTRIATTFIFALKVVRTWQIMNWTA